MRTRAAMCDTGNHKLLWREALTRATAPPQPAPQRWWQIALAFLDRVWL